MSRKQKLPFDSTGGTIVLRRQMIESTAYLGLSPQAKSLLILIQVHWRPFRPVSYGVREAEPKIGCSRKLAMRAFKELQSSGFIHMVDESLFCSRSKSRSRTWRLTWVPWHISKPTNDWEETS